MMPLRRVATGLLFLFLALPGANAAPDDYQEARRLFTQGSYPQALERTDAFLVHQPKDARARFLKGLIFTEQGKQAEAIRIFSSLTEDFPELPEPYNNLAVLYASQGQYDRARGALEMAIRTHPSYATAHENLGDIYAKMASQAYDKALQLDKSNSAAQTKLEMIKELFTGGARAGARPAASTSTPTVAATTRPVATQATAPAVTAPPVATPVPAAKPVVAVETAKPAAVNNESEVIKTVNDWAKAWSDNDVKGYLGFYAPNFQTPGGEPRAEWEASRKIRIAKPRKIEVRVESPKVKFTDSTHAAVTFRQSYRSLNLKASSTKTLVLVRTSDRWLIQQERIGS